MIPSGLTPVAVEPTLTVRVFLREKDGLERWLHWSGTTLTSDRAYRWQGTPSQAKAMKKASKVARPLIAVRVPQPKPQSEVWK